MLRRTLSAVVLSTVVIPWAAISAESQEIRRARTAGRAALQQRGPEGRGANRRELQPGFQTGGTYAVAQSPASAAGSAGRTAAAKPADTSGSRQVHVEVLFIELVAADASKAKLPSLTGTTADVEKALAELKLHGRLKSVQRIKMSVLAGHKAMTQLGETKAVVYGTTAAPGAFGGAAGRPGRGGFSRSYQMRNFGTVLSLSPTVESAGSVVLDLNLEQSGPTGDDDAPKEPGETTAPAGSRTISFRNTLRLLPGEYATVTSSTQQAKKGTSRILVLATARAEGKPATAPTEMSVFHLKHARAESLALVLQKLFAKPPARVLITVDERLNALIVRGDKETLDTIKALVTALDTPGKKAN